MGEHIPMLHPIIPTDVSTNHIHVLSQKHCYPTYYECMLVMMDAQFFSVVLPIASAHLIARSHSLQEQARSSAPAYSPVQWLYDMQLFLKKN